MPATMRIGKKKRQGPWLECPYHDTHRRPWFTGGYDNCPGCNDMLRRHKKRMADRQRKFAWENELRDQQRQDSRPPPGWPGSGPTY
jgi:hypothetical protein